METALAEIIANSQRERGEKFLRSFAFVKFNCGGGICIDHFLIFAKCRELRDKIAGSIYGDRVPIEEQLAVFADQIPVTDWPLISPRLRRYHLKPARRRP